MTSCRLYNSQSLKMHPKTFGSFEYLVIPKSIAKVVTHSFQYYLNGEDDRFSTGEDQSPSHMEPSRSVTGYVRWYLENSRQQSRNLSNMLPGKRHRACRALSISTLLSNSCLNLLVAWLEIEQRKWYRVKQTMCYSRWRAFRSQSRLFWDCKDIWWFVTCSNSSEFILNKNRRFERTEQQVAYFVLFYLNVCGYCFACFLFFYFFISCCIRGFLILFQSGYGASKYDNDRKSGQQEGWKLHLGNCRMWYLIFTDRCNMVRPVP